MSDHTSAPLAPHPATFSKAILEVIASHLREVGVPRWVLDPFAGIGGVHKLRDLAGVTSTFGFEREREWARQHPDTLWGDAFDLLDCVSPRTFDAIVTSPSYGNRMADHHEARDSSERNTYRHKLGRPLSANNSGALQWGDEYRDFHREAWRLAARTLKPGGTFTLNIKNHVRKGVEQRVSEWHISTLMKERRFDLVALDLVPTRGLPVGANANKRTSAEFVVTFRKPAR
jgi:hypothetical protein